MDESLEHKDRSQGLCKKHTKRTLAFKSIRRRKLINHKWSKLSYRPGDVYRVLLGDHDMSQQEGTEQIIDILRIVVHPNWDINHVSDG